MRRRLILVGTAVATTALLVSCGGSKGLSRKDFDTRANAICASVDTTLKKVPAASSSDLSSFAPFAQGIETAYQSYLEQITALAAQAQDHKKIDAGWITPATADFQDEKPLYEQLIAAATKKDTSAFQAVAAKLRAVTDHTAQIQAFQTSYGATACSTLLTDIGS